MEVLRLASVTRMHELSMRQLGELAPHASELTIPTGRRLLLAGSFAQELVLVGCGRGRVRCAGEPVGELGPGDAFGALAPRRAAYAAATVTAIGDLQLVVFATGDIRRLRAQSPATVAALLAACASEPHEREPIPALWLVAPVAA